MSTLSDSEDYDPEMKDIKKPLLPEFSEADGMMPPPPMTSTNTGTMKILLRVRPLKEEEKQEGEDQGCVNVKDSTTLELIPPVNSKAYGHGSVKYSYKFNQVYDDFTSQKILFEDGVMETIKQFLDGENCLLFAYGITNSGKTYTMQGPPTDRGVIPRSFDLVFNSIGNKLWHDADLKPWGYAEVKKLTPTELAAADKLKTQIMNSAAKSMGDNSELYSSCDSLASQSSVGDALLETLDGDGLALDASQEKLKFSVWVSFAEVYNEQIFDLLASPSKQKRTMLVLREDRAGNPYIKDLRHVHVTSAEEASKVLTFGQRSLQYACTKLNESSSRSHCIFTLKIVRVADVANPKKAQTSQLSFCDLAGSERSSRTGNEGGRLKEASNINKSLLTLGQCVKALRKPGRLVPFRESKLTRIFQTFFTGKGLASMLVNISPAASSFDENVHALKFTSFAKQIPMVTSKPDMPQPTPARTALSLSLEQEATQRATIAWGCDEMVDECEEEKENNEDEQTERSDEEYEDSAAITEQYRRAFERLKKALIDANEIIKKERREKEKIKKDARKEMMEQIAIVEKGYQEQMKTHREIQIANSERQMDILATNATKSVRRREQESRVELNRVIEEFKLKLADKDREMEEQNRKFEEKDREMEELNRKLEKANTEMEEMGRKLQERDREVEKLDRKLKDKDREMEMLKKKNTEDDGEDLANNEIFIQLTQRLKNMETALQEKEDEVSELLLQLDTQKEVSDDEKNKQSSGMGGKSAVSRRMMPTVGGTNAHQVTSTFSTPYKAMHTKSSLLRIKAACNSPRKINKCLDDSCYANSASKAGTSGLTTANRLESDTRATKKRKMANKRRTSNVIKRVYETRSKRRKT